MCLSVFCIVLHFSLETVLLFMILSGSHGREDELPEEIVSGDSSEYGDGFTIGDSFHPLDIGAKLNGRK